MVVKESQCVELSQDRVHISFCQITKIPELYSYKLMDTRLPTENLVEPRPFVFETPGCSGFLVPFQLATAALVFSTGLVPPLFLNVIDRGMQESLDFLFDLGRHFTGFSCFFQQILVRCSQNRIGEALNEMFQLLSRVIRHLLIVSDVAFGESA